MSFPLTVLVDGALTGALYAPIALAFVVVYRASGVINFALGEWTMLATALTTTGLWALGLGLPASLGLAGVGMVLFGLAFNRVVLRPLTGRPVIALIMVTLGLGALLRGATAIVFGGVPRRLPLAPLTDPLIVGGVLVAPDKLVAATVAALAAAIAATSRSPGGSSACSPSWPAPCGPSCRAVASVWCCSASRSSPS